MRNMSDKTKAKRINQFYTSTYNQEAKTISGAVYTLKRTKDAGVMARYNSVAGSALSQNSKKK